MERSQLFGPVNPWSPLRRRRVRLFINVFTLEGDHMRITLGWQHWGRLGLRDSITNLRCPSISLAPPLITRQTSAVIYEVVSGVRAH